MIKQNLWLFKGKWSEALRQEHPGRYEDQQGVSVTVTVREVDRSRSSLKTLALTLWKMRCHCKFLKGEEICHTF